MKGKDLFSNITEAREQISRLKREAELLKISPQEAPTSFHDYFHEVVHSLNKQQVELDKKHRQVRQKLPAILAKKQEAQLQSVYIKRKPRSSKNKKEDSTRIEDSFSIAMQNRPLKIYSHHEKNKKAIQFSTDRIVSMNDISIPLDMPVNSRLTKPLPSAHLRRNFQSRKIPKRIDLLQSVQDSIKTSQKNHNYHFQLNFGKINKSSNEYVSYQRVYQSVFNKIAKNLQRLQLLLVEVSEVTLDGRRLAYLCLNDKISEQALFSCLSGANLPLNSSIAKKQSVFSLRFSGKDKFEKAATFIASTWKMLSIKNKYQTLRKKTIIIQRFFRKKLQLLALEKKIRKKNQEIISKFQERQSRFSKQWKTLKVQKRIQIHIGSVERDQQQRLSMEYLSQRQNIQLSRIFRLKNPNLVLIYISRQEIGTQLIGYYGRMLELAGVSDHRERLIFLSPNLTHKFPTHYSTSRLLYYSDKTLQHLRSMTYDIPTILIPGQPCNELIKICDRLDCYLFAGQPQRSKAFTTKSQTKRLLGNLCLPLLPSAMEMYDYGQFLNTFAVLITKNPRIHTWVLKIDDQIQGRGIAFASLGNSKILKNILSEIVDNSPVEGFATQVGNENLQETTLRVRDYLRDHLHEQLQVSTPTVYRGYTDFIGRFVKKGGIIEAHPECSREELCTISVNFELNPDGEHNILSTFEKINGQPFRPIAISFPQKTVEMDVITSTVRQLCDSFKLRKLMGFFSLDFLVQKSTKQHWIIGIDPYLTDHATSFHLFDLLMGGAYISEANSYLLPTAEERKSQRNQQNSNQNIISTREYIFVPYFFQRGLSNIKIKDLFREARLQQFNFDIANRQGICVILLDQLASGVVGLLSVSQTHSQAQQTLKRMLDFLSKMVGNRKLQYGKSQLGGSSDAVTLRDVLSIFSGAIRKSTKINAKQKAIRQYQLNQRLQLL